MSLVKNGLPSTVCGTVPLHSNSNLNARRSASGELGVLSAVTSHLNRMNNMQRDHDQNTSDDQNITDENKENRKRKGSVSLTTCKCSNNDSCNSVLSKENSSPKTLQNSHKSPGYNFSNCKDELELDPSMGISLLRDPSTDDEAAPLLGALLLNLPSNDSDPFLCKRRKFDLRYSGPNLFDKLQCELVLEIFKWLPKVALVKCAQVCTRFKRLALDHSLWRRLELSGRHLPPGALGRVLLRGAAYLRLSKADVSAPVFSPGLQHLPPIDSALLYLDLSMASCDPPALVEIFSVCQRLQKVSLEFLTVSDEALVQLSRCRSLDTLNLSMCVGVHSAGLTILLQRCRNLRHLNLAWTHLSQGAVQVVAGSVPPTLQTLNLSGHRHGQVGDEEVQMLCCTAPYLQELDLSDCTEISGATLQTVASKLRGLTALGLSRCYGLRTDDYGVLASLPHLQHLSLFGANDDTLRGAVRARCPHVAINRQPFSTVARPTVGLRRTSVWGARVRDA